MVSKRIATLILLGWMLLVTATAGADVSPTHAHVRVMQLAGDVSAVSVTLQTGRTVLTNLAASTVSDYFQVDVNQSTFITFGITPRSGTQVFREWPIPPLSPGYYTVAMVGMSADNTLNLIFVDENQLCQGELTCVIVVNNIKGSPALKFIDDAVTVLDGVQYRQAAVNQVMPATYWELAAVDRNNPQIVVFAPQTKPLEANTIYLFGLSGTYPGTAGVDYTMRATPRVPVDTLTFLRGLTADLQLTDGNTLFATENIVAILEESGFDQLVSNPQLNLTVFAPTDGAVLEVAPELYSCVMGSPEAMRALILNHLFVGERTAQELIDAGSLPTMSGMIHTFTAAAGDGFLIDNLAFVDDALAYPTDNGMLYLIDTVLIPARFAEQYCGVG